MRVALILIVLAALIAVPLRMFWRVPAVSAAALRGRATMASAGCGNCHHVPGVEHANAFIAPPLDAFARRAFIAGRIPNDRSNLVRWIQNPSAVDSRTAMPALGLSTSDAGDIADYLRTLN